ARVGFARAGRGPRRDALARQGGHAAGSAAAHQGQHRQEPQRPDRHLRALLRAGAGALLQPRARGRPAGMSVDVARVTPQPPPEKPEAEASLLGSILLDGALFHEVSSRGITASDLSRESHRLVLGAMERLAARGEAIDHRTVAAELASAGELESIGG